MTYIRTITMRRGRGHVAPAELLRVALKAIARGGWRGRVANEFKSYLVNDALPVWRDFETGRVVVLHHLRARGVERKQLRAGFDSEWSMDAPDFLPAGGTKKNELGGEVCAARLSVMRGSVVDWSVDLVASGFAGVAPVEWSSLRAGHDFGFDALAGTSGDYAEGLRFSDGVGGPIDAPEYIAAGCVAKGGSASYGAGFVPVLPAVVRRGAS